MSQSKRDSSSAVGLCGSLWVHALAVLIGAELYTRNVETSWAWLTGPVPRTQPGDAAFSLATPPPQPPEKREPDEEALKRWTRFGLPDGAGVAAHAAEGERALEARRGDMEQAMLSRNPVGPELRQLMESDSVLLSGDGGAAGRRGGAGGPRGVEGMSAAEKTLPFGVSQPPTTPKVLRRPPVPVADVAPPPPPTPVERRPVIAVEEAGPGGPPPLLTHEPTSRPTDRLAHVVQSEPHPSSEPDVRGKPSTRPALVQSLEQTPSQAPEGRRPHVLALATRPSDLTADDAEPVAELPPETAGKALPATRPTEGIPVDRAAAAPRDLVEGPDVPEKSAAAGQMPARSGGAQAGARGEPLAGTGRGGARQPTADQAPKSDSESDAVSAAGGLKVVAGRVDARFGRRVKVIHPDIRLKGGMDALTSLANPKVLMRVDLDEAGKVKLVTVVRSSGSQELDRPTVQAVYRWWIEPPIDPDGKPRADSLHLTYGFLD